MNATRISLTTTALCLTSLAAHAANVGMIAEIRGTVELQRSGAAAWTKATMMKAVAAGDKLRTKADSKATVIFFANGNREQLLPNCQASIQATGCKVSEGPQPKKLARVDAAAAKRLSGTRLGSGRGGGVLMRGGLDKLEIHAGALYDTFTTEARPTFRWTTSARVDQYVLLLYDENDRLVWTTKTSKDSLPYPENAPQLEPGKQYFWELEARRPPRRPKILSGAFKILDPATVKDIRTQAHRLCPNPDKPADASGLVLLTALYSEHNLWDEVIELYERLAKEFPKDDEIAKRLSTLRKDQGRVGG